MYRMSDELRAGRMTEQEFVRAESCMWRANGHCNTMGTASSMAVLTEVLGLALPGNAAIPAVDSRRRVLAQDSGRQAVELVRAGRTPEELSKEFEPSAQTIRNWVKQEDLDAGRRKDGLTSPEREEMARLRRENKQLRIEREILAKAAAWFARETGKIPPGSSDS